MSETRINRAGALTNPPQNMPGQSIAPEPPPTKHRQTGPGTSPDPTKDVQDPHPSDEEHPYREKRPGGANPPSDVTMGSDDIGPNPARHDGKARPRPQNSGGGSA
jgi:hypothetical protein